MGPDAIINFKRKGFLKVCRRVSLPLCTTPSESRGVGHQENLDLPPLERHSLIRVFWMIQNLNLQPISMY